MMAVVAAIMSTADSCLLSLSSILTKDVFARWRGLTGEATERLTGTGALSSVLVMAVLVTVALRPITTLWDLLVIKFEVLIQLSPAFVLGTWHEDDEPRRFASPEIVAGIVTGLAVALGLTFSGHRSWIGFHAGTLGVVANYSVAAVGREIRLRRPSGSV